MEFAKKTWGIFIALQKTHVLNFSGEEQITVSLHSGTKGPKEYKDIPSFPDIVFINSIDSTLIDLNKFIF